MGAEVNPVDGMDAQHRQTGRSLLASGHHHRPARLHYRGPECIFRKIGSNVTPKQGASMQPSGFKRDVDSGPF